MQQLDLIAPERKKPPPRLTELLEMATAGLVKLQAYVRPATPRKKRRARRRHQLNLRWPSRPWETAH